MTDRFFKQPNGKYCCLSYFGIEEYDLSEEDIKNFFIEKAKTEACAAVKNAKNYGEIIEEYLNKNVDEKTRDRMLKKIGFTEPYSELVKYVPRRPTHQQYVACNFTTYGNCPTCGTRVENCMGNAPEKCSCGQRLKWV